MNQLQSATGTDDVSRAVIDAVADAEGVPPVELTPPLYEAIDLDALDHLFAATSTDDRAGGEVTFQYSDYVVTVDDGGNVSVEPRDE